MCLALVRSEQGGPYASATQQPPRPKPPPPRPSVVVEDTGAIQPGHGNEQGGPYASADQQPPKPKPPPPPLNVVVEDTGAVQPGRGNEHWPPGLGKAKPPPPRLPIVVEEREIAQSPAVISAAAAPLSASQEQAQRGQHTDAMHWTNFLRNQEEDGIIREPLVLVRGWPMLGWHKSRSPPKHPSPPLRGNVSTPPPPLRGDVVASPPMAHSSGASQPTV